MADTFIDTQNEDAARQQVASKFFYLLGDVLGGSDVQPRLDPGMTGSGVLGPTQNPWDVGVGSNGEIYRRGTTNVAGTQASQAAVPTTGTILGMSPLMLLVVAAAVVFIAKKL